MYTLLYFCLFDRRGPFLSVASTSFFSGISVDCSLTSNVSRRRFFADGGNRFSVLSISSNNVSLFESIFTVFSSNTSSRTSARLIQLASVSVLLVSASLKMFYSNMISLAMILPFLLYIWINKSKLPSFQSRWRQTSSCVV